MGTVKLDALAAQHGENDLTAKILRVENKRGKIFTLKSSSDTQNRKYTGAYLTEQDMNHFVHFFGDIFFSFSDFEKIYTKT